MPWTPTRDFAQAVRAARQMFALRGLPKPLGMVLRWLKGGKMRAAARRTLAQALAEHTQPRAAPVAFAAMG